MYLKRLVCRNLRGFTSLDLDLCPLAPGGSADRDTEDRSLLAQIDDVTRVTGTGTSPALFDVADPDSHYPGWSVITGDNGAGKTTLLKAIAVAILGPDQARYLQPSYAGWVAHEALSAEISLEIRPDTSIDKSKGGGAPHKNTFWAEVDIGLDRTSPSLSSSWTAFPSDHFRKKKKGASNGPWQQTTDGWLALGYGPFRRLYGSSPAAAGLEADPIKARFATLFMEDATLIEAEKWLKDLDYRSARAGTEAQKHEAATTLLAVTEILKADFLRNGMNFERVDAEGVWLSDHTGRELRLKDMSEGYRAALATLIDIIRHMVLCYGPEKLFKFDNETGQPIVDQPAVVLIDEIDAHLHPLWQRDIGFWLKSHFPRIQFIVTTHSPLVCQAADGGRIYVLPDPLSGESPRRMSNQEYVRVVSGSADTVLQTAAFGLSDTRSIRVREAMKSHSRMKQLSQAGQQELWQSSIKQLELFLSGELPD